MSQTREPWWGFCRNIVRMYPVYLDRYRVLHNVRMTTNYTGLPGDSTPSRSTEEVATRELTQTEQRSLDAVEAAIRATLRRMMEKNGYGSLGWSTGPSSSTKG